MSFVDSDFGLGPEIGSLLFDKLKSMPKLPSAVSSVLANLDEAVDSLGGSEENPQDIALGEAFVSQVVQAVMASPTWKSTLLIWTYDEHGGYYDHVQPASVPEPDSIQPMIASTDIQGAYNITGMRVPTVVVSPYSKPNEVTNVMHDHTSVIATIRARKWNLLGIDLPRRQRQYPARLPGPQLAAGLPQPAQAGGAFLAHLGSGRLRHRPAAGDPAFAGHHGVFTGASPAGATGPRPEDRGGAFQGLGEELGAGKADRLRDCERHSGASRNPGPLGAHSEPLDPARDTAPRSVGAGASGWAPTKRGLARAGRPLPHPPPFGRTPCRGRLSPG